MPQEQHRTLMSQGHQCLAVKWKLRNKDEPGKARCTAGGKHCHSERSSACCGSSVSLFSPYWSLNPPAPSLPPAVEPTMTVDVPNPRWYEEGRRKSENKSLESAVVTNDRTSSICGGQRAGSEQHPSVCPLHGFLKSKCGSIINSQPRLYLSL